MVRCIALVLLGGCLSPADGQFLCEAPDFVCPEGMSCVAGVCRVRAPDAGMRDAGNDASFDAGPLPEESEVCEPIDARDEDGDGAIDEGCVTLGLVHSPVALHYAVSSPEHAYASHFGPELARGGLSYYVAASLATTAYVVRADRAALDQPFGALTLQGAAPGAVSVTDDELEMFADGIQIATRASRDQLFGAFAPIPTTQEPGVQRYPAISRDGLELYYVHLDDIGEQGAIKRVVRPDRASSFGAPELVYEGGELGYLRLSADGRTLRFKIGTEHAFLHRADTVQPFRGAPAIDRRIERSAAYVFQDDAARELWYTLLTEGGNTTDPRAPLPISVLRAEICSPACMFTPIVCNAGETRSADGLHCYGLTDSAGGGYGFALDRCTALYPGSTLVSVHTDQETQDLLPLIGAAPKWLGMVRESVSAEFTWFSGEPFLWTRGTDPRWVPGHPTNGGGDRCALIQIDGTWGSWACAGAIGICERTLWPTW